MLIKALLRGGIPFIIMGGIALSLYFQGKYADAKSTFLTGLIILIVGAGSIIYNIDHWSITKQSSIHFIVMFLTIYPILLFSGWFTVTSIFDALIVLVYFVITGIILWLVFFMLTNIFS